VPSRSGRLVASISRDRSLRLWKRIDDQLFVDEDNEEDPDDYIEASAATSGIAYAEAQTPAEVGSSEPSVVARRTIESVQGAERVLEALKVLDEERDRRAEHVAATAAAMEKGHQPPALVPNMLLLGLDEGSYLTMVLSQVRPSELEQALLVLPYDAAKALLAHVLPVLPSVPPIERLFRCILFLIKVLALLAGRLAVAIIAP